MQRREPTCRYARSPADAKAGAHVSLREVAGGCNGGTAKIATLRRRKREPRARRISHVSAL